MRVLVLGHALVEVLLPIPECIPVMEDAFRALARGDLHQPLRTIVRPASANGLLGLMPSYRSGTKPRYGLKAVTVFPGNPSRGLDAHQGSVLLFSGEDGTLQALLNASAITAIRTAAVSALATRLLARDDASELALLGTGTQARAHLVAMAAVRKIRRARVASRDPEHARRFAAAAGPTVGFPVEAVSGVAEAVAGADLIVTATSSAEPILRREWVSAGAHVNAVGSSTSHAREIEGPLLRDARLFVDRRESTLAESGDYLFAAREGLVGPDHIRGEIGEILLGERPGRCSRDEITLFKSLGLAVEDLAAAEEIHRRALERGVGAWVDL